ncbi:MAG: pantoate--beta-alanine ligase [Planctomycetaceae bacterium]
MAGASHTTSATGPVLIADPDSMRRAVLAARGRGRRIGFAPTMGALHAGHVSLVDRAVADCDDVVVSIFVNPTQFGPGEDYGRYPRTLAADLAALEGHGATWIFTPDAGAMYPPGWATRIEVDGPARRFEGEVRPGHFTGVATVVCRLFLAVPADIAYFGAKDWQQTLVVKRMVRDLGLPIDVMVCPTVREPDGLAMSSRNAYLDREERHRATALHESLRLAEQAWRAGDAVDGIERHMRLHLGSRGVAADYAVIVDPESLEPLARPDAEAIALVAGRVGGTRLIDNLLLPPRG